MLLCSDRALLEAFRRGEAAALARVYQHYFPLVADLVGKGFSFDSAGQRLRYRGAGASPDAFDLVHDVFAALFEDGARRSYGGLAPYAAYVTTTARNRIISRLRRDKARLIESIDASDAGDGATVVDGSPSPEQQLINRQVESLVKQYLSEQTHQMRELVRHRFADDLSQEQVAAALHLSRKQVRRLEKTLHAGLLRRLRGTPVRRLTNLIGVLV